MRPERIQSAVLVPMTFAGAEIEISGSCAVFFVRALRVSLTPAPMLPPKKQPFLSSTLIVVVNNNAGHGVFIHCGNRACGKVGAKLGGVVNFNVKAGFNAWAKHQGHNAEKF